MFSINLLVCSSITDKFIPGLWSFPSKDHLPKGIPRLEELHDRKAVLSCAAGKEDHQSIYYTAGYSYESTLWITKKKHRMSLQSHWNLSRNLRDILQSFSFPFFNISIPSTYIFSRNYQHIPWGICILL